MTSFRTAVLLVTCGCCLAAATAAAQRAPSRAPRGPQMNASVYGGYDVPLFASNALATLQPSSQGFGGVDTALTYTRPGRRVAVSAMANASNRYYPQFTPSSAPSYGGGLNISSVSTGRWQWSLDQFAHYAPLTATSLFAGANASNSQAIALANAAAFQTSTLRQVNLTSSAMLSYAPRRRMQVSLIGMAENLLPIDSPVTRSTRLNARARLSRDLTRRLRGYVGYAVIQNRQAGDATSPASTSSIGGLDVGIDFSRPFQLTRTTTMGFQAGVLAVPEGGSKSYQFVGTVTLDRQIRRTWQAQLAATRDARFVQTYKYPVVMSGVTAAAGGRLAGKLGSQLSANYSAGKINTPSDKSSFSSYTAAALLRYDLGGLIAAFTEYAVFAYDVGASPDLIGFPAGRFGRHSIRGGLSIGVSPFQR